MMTLVFLLLFEDWFINIEKCNKNIREVVTGRQF